MDFTKMPKSVWFSLDRLPLTLTPRPAEPESFRGISKVMNSGAKSEGNTRSSSSGCCRYWWKRNMSFSICFTWLWKGKTKSESLLWFCNTQMQATFYLKQLQQKNNLWTLEQELLWHKTRKGRDRWSVIKEIGMRTRTWKDTGKIKRRCSIRETGGENAWMASNMLDIFKSCNYQLALLCKRTLQFSSQYHKIRVRTVL